MYGTASLGNNLNRLYLLGTSSAFCLVASFFICKLVHKLGFLFVYLELALALVVVHLMLDETGRTTGYPFSCTKRKCTLGPRRASIARCRN